MTTVLFVTQGTGNWTKIKMAVKDESLSYSLDHFTEVQEVTTLIESIGSICHDDILLEAAEERFIGKFALFFLLFTCQDILCCPLVSLVHALMLYFKF